MIRALVVEDSVTARALLVEILRSDPEIDLVGEAGTGAEAVEMTKELRPDIVTMDIHMPQMNGFEATKQIMIEAPTPIVIVSGSLDVRAVEISMHALKAGALTVIPKPAGPASPNFEEEKERFLGAVKSMSQVKVVRRWRDRALPEGSARTPPGNGMARVIAIAASTGGPGALSKLLSELPGNLPVPILIVQHMSLGFGEGFVSWLNSAVSLKVKTAEQGEELLPGAVYVAPDDRHLGVSEQGSVLLSSGPPVGGFRPSGSYLFQSVAKVYGAGSLAVVLTGMGQDGVEGLRKIREAGGRIIAQDEESSVVYGMPKAAVAAGLVDHVLPLPGIAQRILACVSRGKTS